MLPAIVGLSWGRLVIASTFALWMSSSTPAAPIAVEPGLGLSSSCSSACCTGC
jgi:hypothetical protein